MSSNVISNLHVETWSVASVTAMAMMTTVRSCQGVRGCRCALHVDQSTGSCSFDASACVLHARRAEDLSGLAGWFDGVCVFCQRGGSGGRTTPSQREGGIPWRSVAVEAAGMRIDFGHEGEGREQGIRADGDAGFGQLRQGLRSRSAALRTTDYIVREQAARPADAVSVLLGTQPRRQQRGPSQISAAAAIQQAGQRMRREERAEAEAAAAAAEAAAAKAAEEAAATKQKLQGAEEALDRMTASLEAERKAREDLEYELAKEREARTAAQVAEAEWKRRYEEELQKRKAADAARDSAIAERDDAQELLEIAEEDAKRARGLWVAAAWKGAWDRKQRDHARAEAAAANEKATRAEAASAADREARATMEHLATIDKREREAAAARALLDRQARETAERRAAEEAAARADLAESYARAVADAESAKKGNDEAAAAVAAEKSRAEMAEAAERAATAEAMDAKERYKIAALELASTASEVARLKAMIGEVGAAGEAAATAQAQAIASIQAELAEQRTSREAAEADATKARERAKAAEAKAAQAASSTWQIAMLRTQLDVLRSTRQALEERITELGEAHEQAEARLGEAVARTAVAEANMERAEDDAAAARAELAPLAVEAAEARAEAAAAEQARQEEMERRFAAENERRRRIDRVRRNRDRQSVAFSASATSSDTKVATARRKKLEKNVSTYLGARLLRMPRGHKKPRFAFQVEMDVDSLNRSECFVLDMGDRIYLYQGGSATPFDKTAAAEFADYLEKAKNGAATLEDADVHFWKLMNGTEDEVRDEATDVRDEDDDHDIMSPGGAAFVNQGDGSGWARATRPQTEEQIARVVTR